MIAVFLSMIEGEENRRSFEELYNKYRKRVISICKKFVKKAEYVDDACSETFFNLAKAYDRVKDLEVHKMDYYIYITARNASLHILNKEKDSMNNISLDEIEDIVADEELENNASDLLAEYMEKLDEWEQEIIYLRIKLELDYKTIGVMMHIKPNTARQRFLRAKTHLAEMLKGEK